jgi:hypothetical protein
MSSSPTRRSTRHSKLTEKGLANLNQAKLVSDVVTAAPLDTTDSPSADSPLPNTNIAMTTKKSKAKGKAKADSPSADSPLPDTSIAVTTTIPKAKGNAKATKKAKAKGNSKVSSAMASSASPTKKKRKVGYKKLRNIRQNKKKSNDTDNDEDYKDEDDYSEPSALDNLLELMEDDDVEEEEEEVSEEGGDRYVIFNCV